MGVAIKIIVASIVSLVAGYNLYPLIHQNPVGQSSAVVSEILTSEPTAQNTIITTFDSVAITSKPEVINTQSSKSRFERAAATKMNRSKVANAQVFNQSSESSSLSPEGIEQQEALTLWSVEHQVKVRGILEGYLPLENIDSWLEYLVTDNKLLDNPKLRQEAELDSNWAIETEQTIRDLIQQHEYGFDVEILSLVCKQLICEFVIRQTAKGSWFEIYISLFKHFSSSGIGINGEGGKNLSESTDAGYIYYAQLLFSDPDEPSQLFLNKNKRNNK